MIHVVAAVIRNGNQILLARRPDHLHQGGLWEFPGGKVDSSEGRQAALTRELQEELGITPANVRPVIRIPHHYHDKSVLLDVWEVNEWQGEPHGKEGQEIRWVNETELRQYQFPEANHPIVTACQLPVHYLITPAFEGDEKQFLNQLEVALNNGIRLVQYRQKGLSDELFESLAIQVIDVCHRYGAKVLLNANPELVICLQADGIQLNAPKLISINERPLPERFMVSASCHNANEVQQACKLHLDFMVLSPVQPTASHPDAEPLGWQQFEVLTETSTIPVYALGGVSKDDTAKAWQHGGQGVSAIRALWGT